MERKKFKGILSCLFGGRQKVKVSKFFFDVFIFVVSSAAHSVGTTLDFEVFRSGPDPEYSRVSAFWFFLSTTMVFAAVRTHFPRKTPACLVDRTAINKQQFKYNEHNFKRSGRLVDWLELFPTIRAAGVHIRERGKFFYYSFSFLFFFFWPGGG